ncbi:MAG: glycosyltransferase family 2 protein [Planctomycetales bacterium]|nr:glycosyltransferase family 2 protein [Planctomycetales bacterium]
MSEQSGQRRRLSIAIIARNAAEALAETLVSVRNLADEIVVLDTGSTDETPMIAERLGAKLFRKPWEDSFAAARNACLTHVSGDWVLWMDAGERLENDEGRLVREFVEEHADLATAYLLRVALPGQEACISGEQIASVRLHPNRPGLIFHGRVRESLTRSAFSFGMKLEHLPLTLHRSVRDHNQETKAAKAARNIQLADLQIAERGPTADLHNCLGEASQTLGQHETALGHYQRAKESAEPASAEMLEAYYGLLTCLEKIPARNSVVRGEAPLSQNRTAQISLALEALEVFPLDAQLLCALGGYLQSLGQRELAAKSYEVAYRHGQVEPEIWHLPDIREVAAVCNSVLLQLDGKDDAALALLGEAWMAYPESLRIGRQVVELHVKHGRRDEALLAVSKLAADLPGKETWRTAVQGACAAVAANWTAAKTLLETAYRGGCRERFCLRWLCVTLLATGNTATAEVVLKVWQSIDGTNPELAHIRDTIDEQLARDNAPPAEIEIAGSSGIGGSMRVDPAQDASPAAGQAKRRSGINIS